MKTPNLESRWVLVWGSLAKYKRYSWDSNPVFQTLNSSPYPPHYLFLARDLLNRKSVPLEKGKKRKSPGCIREYNLCRTPPPPPARMSLEQSCVHNGDRNNTCEVGLGGEPWAWSWVCAVLWLGGSDPPVFREHLSYTGHSNLQSFSPCLHGLAV